MMLRTLFVLLLSARFVTCNEYTEIVLENAAVSYFISAFNTFWDIIGPGGKLHPAYFLEHKGHLAIEGALLVLIIFLFLQKSYKVSPKAERALTDKEVDELCKEWVPEPLVSNQETAAWSPPVVESEIGLHAVINGRKVLNLGTQDFLGLSDNPVVKEAGRKAICKYGVGSCGPRGFYGTVDVHLKLESDLAKFMHTDGAIIYSFDTATISSVIPAFASRKDIVIVDEACNYSIQSGCTVSRARVFRFKHNDVEDLARVITEVEAEEHRKRKPLCRKYIVVEGVYADLGDLAPLDKIFTVKERFQYRLIVDESLALGVLGNSGRGACEHFGLAPGQAEIVVSSMSCALGSAGGFCVGDLTIVDHQRLSGLGYCFSASLPPYLAVAASTSLDQLQSVEELPRQARQIAEDMAQALNDVAGFRQLSHRSAPVKVLTLADSGLSAAAEGGVLTRVADAMLAHGFLVCPSRHSNLHRYRGPETLRLSARVGVDAAQVAALVAALKESLQQALRA